MCADALASGDVVEVLADYALDPVTVYVVFPAGRRPSQKARAFSDYLEQAMARAGEEQTSGATVGGAMAASVRKSPAPANDP